MGKRIVMNDFYCFKCGKKGVPIIRKNGAEREVGHLKKLYCLNCKEETNHVEIKPFSTKYSYKDFKNEYEYGNFTEEGLRIRKYGELKELIRNGKIHKVKTLDNVRDSGLGEEHLD